MKNKWFLWLFLLPLIFLSFSTGGNTAGIGMVANSVPIDIHEDCIIRWSRLTSFNVPYEEGKNFEIFVDTESGFLMSYNYRIWDNNGDLIDENYHWGPFNISETESEGILVVKLGYGFSTWRHRYYDVANGRVSRLFHKPVATYGELVAYFKIPDDGDITLVIQNMFEPSTYYEEISRNFSGMVIRDFREAEFIENGNRLKITYWIEPNDEEVVEVIDLTSVTETLNVVRRSDSNPKTGIVLSVAPLLITGSVVLVAKKRK